MVRITVITLACLLLCLWGNPTQAPPSEVRAESVTVGAQLDDQSPKLVPQQAQEEPVEKTVSADYSQADYELLARLVSAEAKGESLEGQIAVANVVLNRVASPCFPDTIKGVIYQQTNGRYQFCPVRNGSINREPTSQAQEAARLALEGKQLVAPDALYFYNPRLARSGWIRTRPVVEVIGNHNFAG